MPNLFVDVRQDLVYAYGFISRLVRPIWKVKRAPKRAYSSFRRFSCAIAHHFWVIRIPTSKVPNLFVDIRQDLVYAYGWSSRLVRPIWRVKRSLKRVYASFRRFSCSIAHHFLGDPDFDVKNAKFVHGHLSRPCLCIRVKRAPKRAYASFRRFSCAIAHHFLGDLDSDVKNAKFFRGRPSRPCICIRVKRAPKRAYASFRRFSCAIAHHFLGDPDSDVKSAKYFRGCPPKPCLCIRVKRAPKRAYASYRRFSCAIAHHFWGDPDSDVKNAKFFRRRPSRPRLCILLAITACPAHLEGQTSLEASIRLISTIFGQTSPESSIRLISMIFVCYSTPFFGAKRAPKRAYASFRRFSCAIAHHFLGDPDSDVKNAKFVRERPSRPCLCIWVKQAPKRAYASFRRFSCAIGHYFLGDPDSDVKNAKYFRGRPSRPCLCIQMAITACPTHLEGQTSPEASIRLILTIFVCYSTPFFWVIRIPMSKMPNFFVDVRQDLVYAYAHHFLGDPDSNVKNAKFVRGRPSRPCLCIQLSITACPAHLEAHHFFGDPDSDVKNAKFFCGRPSRPCVCIQLAIKASHHFLGYPDSNVKNAKFVRGRPSRPCLCIRLAITACPSHLEDLVYAYGWPSRLVRPIWRVKRALKRAYALFRRFSCAIAHHFLGDPDSDVKNANFFVDVRQDLVSAYGCPSRLFRPIWRAKRAPKRAYASFRQFSCVIAHHFLGDPDSDVKNAKFVRGRPSRPCLCIQLAITACLSHLECQTSP
uniref:Uncharacterized protein n=1 Tax=Solanum lycopersicum TaxID=4081 RepID=A0A3Q7FY91_SOLLC